MALKIQSLIPNTDNNSLTANWDPRIPNQRFQQIPSVKIDHNFNPDSKLSGYWSVQDTTQITGADGLPIPITGRRDQKIYGHTSASTSIRPFRRGSYFTWARDIFASTTRTARLTT